MNFKLLLLTLVLRTPLLAEPLLQLHDGSAWKPLEAEAYAKLPRVELTARARNGELQRYSGIPLAEILKTVSAPSGEKLRGPEMDRIVLLKAADGYQVAFSLAELDPSFRKTTAILVDRVNDRPLDDFEGPYMVVVPDDLRHSRWIRQVRRIVLTRAPSPPP